MKNSISCEERDYKHFGKCLFVSNKVIEFAASLDFGIRILSFCLCGRQNVFYEQPAGADYLCTKEGWRVYGGHRLAFAPESEKTYWPDNTPVQYQMLQDGVRFDQKIDGYLNIEKSLELCFTDNPQELSVKHFVRNAGNCIISGAPWAITAVGPRGRLFIPFPPSCDIVSPAPDRFISLWNSTSLTDKRLYFKKEGLSIRHLPLDDYFKIGLRCKKSPVVYEIGKQIFCKTFEFYDGAVYPDNNVNLEIFSGKYMMELESLGPTGTIKPGEGAVHKELWNLMLKH
jgi:hypothetical protein